jgi:phage shock protein C
MAHPLHRSTSDAMLGGVCGGLGKYFDIDVNLIRLIFVVFAVLPAFGLPVYLVLWLIVPEEGEDAARPLANRVRDGTDEIVGRAKKLGEEVRSTARHSNRAATLVIGLLLIVLGAILLLRNLGITWLSWIAFGTLWPVLLILVGAAFLWRWLKGGDRRAHP